MGWWSRTAARVVADADDRMLFRSSGDRQHVRDEISMGEVEPRNWLERAWRDDAQDKGWL